MRLQLLERTILKLFEWLLELSQIYVEMVRIIPQENQKMTSYLFSFLEIFQLIYIYTYIYIEVPSLNAEKLHAVLKEHGSIRALLGMTRSGNNEVIAQVARGLANFAKCESRRIMKGTINHLFHCDYTVQPS